MGRNSDRVCRTTSALGLLAVALATLGPRAARAQSFTYRQLNGTRTVSLVVNATGDLTTIPTSGGGELSMGRHAEFPVDTFGDMGTPNRARPSNWPANLRIAANLRRRFRLVGGPYIRNATIWFDRFDMDPSLIGGVANTHDRVALHWNVTSPPTNTLTSPPPNPFATTITLPTPSFASSLMNPSAVFWVITGPDIAASSSDGAFDRESWGARTSSIVIEGTGSPAGASTPPTIGLYDNVIGIVQETDDVVDMAFPVMSTTQTTAFWVHPTESLPGTIEVRSRCGQLPTATLYDYRQVISNSHRSDFWTHNNCGAGVARFFTVTNVGQPGRAFRMMLGSHIATRTFQNLNVGITFNANATELSRIRGEFRRAAWMFYGITGGTHTIYSYRFYNNATGCESVSGCSGLFCNVCVHSGTGMKHCETAIDQVSVSMDHVQNSGDTLVHEFSHCFAGQQGYENYRNRCDSVGWCQCPEGIGPGMVNPSIPVSVPSWMGVYETNNFVYSSSQDHRRTAVNWDLLRTQQGPNQVACNGGWTPSGDPSTDWERMDSSDVPVNFPNAVDAQTAPQHRLSAFWYSTSLGYPAQLQ